MTEPARVRVPDYRASADPKLQPFRDPITGEVVTLTPSHCNAIRQALEVYKQVAQPPVFDVGAAIGILSFLNAKSCLMARLLYDGRPPLVDAPPLVMAAPDYSLEVPREDEPHEFGAVCPEPGCEVYLTGGTRQVLRNLVTDHTRRVHSW